MKYSWLAFGYIKGVAVAAIYLQNEFAKEIYTRTHKLAKLVRFSPESERRLVLKKGSNIYALASAALRSP